MALVPGLIVQTCGSYRRGKATCGDVDILITHTDGISHQNLLIPLVDSLKKSGNFLKFYRNLIMLIRQKLIIVNTLHLKIRNLFLRVVIK